MQADEAGGQAMEALRERLSRLSEASRRINESLDFETVLQGVLDSARSLTGSRYGVITLLDDQGRIRDFVYSGLTPGESRQFGELPDGMAFFEYLSSIREPLRLQDFHSYTRSLGLPEFRPPFPVSSPLPFLAAPIRHRDEAIGAIYVGETEQEFTAEDEETLVMFASQAALVIANARRHRGGAAGQVRPGGPGEHRSRRRAGIRRRDGNPVSVNREARRIVSGLCEPGGVGGAAPGGADLPAGRRAGGLPSGVPPGPGADDGGDGASGGDRAAGPRRAQRDHPGQLHAHLLGGWGGRVGGRHHAGHDAAGGDGAAAGRVPGHGEPRTASPADLHQGLRRHPAGIPELPGPPP